MRSASCGNAWEIPGFGEFGVRSFRFICSSLMIVLIERKNRCSPATFVGIGGSDVECSGDMQSATLRISAWELRRAF